MKLTNLSGKYITPERIFMFSALFVNAGNYIYNLALGRLLGPKEFADAAILITFLLVLSFLAMTFQLVTAKYAVLFENNVFINFLGLLTKYTFLIGVMLGVLIIVFSKNLQNIFNTSTSNMFVYFGLGVPIYFLMSINRGVFQGYKKFDQLSITYQSEMLSRLIITLTLLYFIKVQSSILVAIGILISFVFGMFPFKIKRIPIKKIVLSSEHKRVVLKFFLLTAFYECTQIIINNSDILLVKHYFDSYQAGLYASLALIGRVVYFVAWMFVMLLLPTVVKKEKERQPHAGVLLKYVGYISLLSLAIVTGSYLFPELVVKIMFGKAYISIAPLLWKYALATSVFAISNVFAYYFLSIDRYVPVILSALLGVAQVVLIIWFHDSLDQVVLVQIIAMMLLLLVQLLFFSSYILKKRNTVKQ
ncbi:O-antigen/teichoic acid export membrane protein [Tenacibaculum adriaticum]|uniref:O-antigen/teichoic acid export membrane protein n=1 Tax=Tenacibaculum adriaticum TaxID=413713 RepID=A0A5S5DM44_9FLAO|nr:oligosaccharide flippase family protein [Tenacibaculum adriaticum]TYP96714.1 O-antigen/teichoic acid export membrane protein [Tenacibaculum adriaticum]